MNFKEFIFESKNLKIQTAVTGFDEGFIPTLIDKLSFLYKKRKDRYIRPLKVVGYVTDVMVIRVNMSNKDIILVNYKGDELRVSLNGEVVYHMDLIEKKSIISKIDIIYKKHIMNNNYKVVDNSNPFNESKTLDEIIKVDSENITMYDVLTLDELDDYSYNKDYSIYWTPENVTITWVGNNIKNIEMDIIFEIFEEGAVNEEVNDFTKHFIFTQDDYKFKIVDNNNYNNANTVEIYFSTKNIIIKK